MAIGGLAPALCRPQRRQALWRPNCDRPPTSGGLSPRQKRGLQKHVLTKMRHGATWIFAGISQKVDARTKSVRWSDFHRCGTRSPRKGLPRRCQKRQSVVMNVTRKACDWVDQKLIGAGKKTSACVAVARRRDETPTSGCATGR